MKANSGHLDQMPPSVVSDLGLYCLHMSHRKDARLIWINGTCMRRLPTIFANCIMFGPGQSHYKVGPDLGPYCLAL